MKLLDIFKLQTTSIPIRVLTRAKSSRSNDRLLIGYLLRNFQPNRSNFLVHSPPPPLTRLKGGRHERGFGLFLKELNMDSLNRRLESYCLQTTEALAYWMSLMHLPPTLPSWARSEASIFFPNQNFKTSFRTIVRRYYEIIIILTLSYFCYYISYINFKKDF